jgi:arylsulfatase A-like enzyme
MDLDAGHGFGEVSGFGDEGLVDDCIDFLDRDRDDPFFLAASFDDPHNICEYGRGQNLPWGEIDEPPIEDCPSLPHNFAVPPYEPSPIRPALDAEQRTLGAMSDASLNEWRRYRNAYYRLIERVDARIGRLLSALDTRDLTDDTVIVFLSDHGDGAGAHRVNQKWLLYEEPTRVPLLIRPPTHSGVSGQGASDSTPRGVTNDSLVSIGLDLLPTLCAYADISSPADLRGYDLRPLVNGEKADAWRDFLVTETEHPLAGRMVRTPQYKYVVYAMGRHREQLFDMREDRGELVDLSVNAAYDEVLDEHRRHLLRWSRETGDVFAQRGAQQGAPLIPGFELREIKEYIQGGLEPSE